jgi:hypothetical protein
MASTQAFHLAMLATALLLGLGAAVNAVGLPRSEGASDDEPKEADRPDVATPEPQADG